MSNGVGGSGSSGQDGGGAYRVMVVDDSAVVRGLVTRSIESDPDMRVVASVGNGQRALETLERHAVDVVVLDIEMPVMDGLSALPRLLETQPDVQVIIASTLSKANADVTIRALNAGAADYVTKPNTGGLHSKESFHAELKQKVKALGAARRQGGPKAAPGGAKPPRRDAAAPARAQQTAARPVGEAAPRVVTSGLPERPPEVIAIGSSTGGPQALFQVLGALGRIDQPVLVTQHMPATFTALLAEHIGRQTGLPACEARDGEPVKRGHVYIAPGGHHMLVERSGTGAVLRLSDAPAENFCRPSVDPMLRSLSQVYGAGVLAVILTGMGSDGCKGCQDLVKAGGKVIAQDEATSVVWGMPGAVAKAGICSAVLPLGEIAPQLRRIAVRSAA